MMIQRCAAIVAAALGAAMAFTAPATAGDATPDAAGRYMFNNTADGVVRLDTQSGQVSLCSQKGINWVCEAAPEDRAVLENEIARLRAENGALKKDILARGLPLPPGATAEAPTAQNSATQNNTSPNSITVPLPSDADIDRMTALANRVWNRFKEMVGRAQQQLFNKS
jgi:hypothetical protein